MKRRLTFYTPKRTDMRRYYIVTEPAKLSDIKLEKLEALGEFDFLDNSWEEKAQRLRARRWRKLKNQLV